MKKNNNFQLEDLVVILIEMFTEIRDLLKANPSIPQASNDTDYQDAADTKRRLNVSNSTLYRWRREGLIDYQIKKGKIYYDILSVLKRK